MAESTVLCEDYRKNTEMMSEMLRVGSSFDIIKKTVALEAGELTLYYVDGLIKDDTLFKLIQHFYTVKGELCDAAEFIKRHVPYVEAEACGYTDELCRRDAWKRLWRMGCYHRCAHLSRAYDLGAGDG